VLSKKLFADLLSPAYKNFKTAITKMSNQFKQASEVESPGPTAMTTRTSSTSTATTAATRLGSR